MNKFEIKFFTLVGLFLALLLMGCDRMFKDSITFRGQVYVTASTTTAVACSGAVVQVVGYDVNAITAGNGAYSLNIETSRSFVLPKTDNYTIQAFDPASSENASATVSAKPGDDIKVAPLVLID
ncbi:hypothetical protein KJ633_01480 [bacterium]|nr:hypothetical protein [bacterium]MBU3955110.1 hypothetical protein [bacterium]MBU4134632.1 hypothetical protein [bacterium]